jgi:mRNA interferase RelE/StbE
MTWQIDFSREALKFIEKNNIVEDDIIQSLNKFVRRLKGEAINVDLKKMKGKWKGFYRLRDGKKRLIFQPNFDQHKIYLDRIDFRGDVYK